MKLSTGLFINVATMVLSLLVFAIIKLPITLTGVAFAAIAIFLFGLDELRKGN